MENNILQIKEWIISQSPGVQNFDGDYDLIENRVLDSLQFLELINQIEELSGRIVDTAEITITDFLTLNRIEKKVFFGIKPFYPFIKRLPLDKPIYIEYLDCYLPETMLEVADCPERLPESIGAFFRGRKEFLDFSTSVLHLDNVRVERQLDLEKMVMLLLDEYMQRRRADASSVDYLIIATDFGHHLKDFGHRILKRMAIPRSTIFRVADNYCANIDIAIGLAATLLRAKQTPSRAIILSGVKVGDSLPERVVGTYGIFGDCAGMMVLSNEEGSHLAEFGGQAVVTRGELADLDLTKDNTLLHLQSYSKCLKDLLSQSGLSPSMVDQVVLHNANQMLLQLVIKSCGIDSRAINRSNLGKFGHLGTCDLVLNLKTILEQGGKGAGNIVSLNLGVIGTYVSTLFKQ